MHQFVFLSDTFCTLHSSERWFIFPTFHSVQMNDVLDPVPPFPELALTDMVCVSKRTFFFFFFWQEWNHFPPQKEPGSGLFEPQFWLQPRLISLAGDVIASSVSIRRRIPRVMHHPGSCSQTRQSIVFRRARFDRWGGCPAFRRACLRAHVTTAKS